MGKILILEEVMQKALEDDNPNLALYVYEDFFITIQDKPCDFVFYCGQYRELDIDNIIVSPLLPDLKPEQIYDEIFKKIEENSHTRLIGIRRHSTTLGEGNINKIYSGKIDFYRIDNLPRNVREFYVASEADFNENEKDWQKYREHLNKLIEQIELHPALS